MTRKAGPEWARRSFTVFMLALSMALICGMEMMEHAEELGTLQEQGKDEAQKEKHLAEQEARFQAVRQALIGKELKIGVLSKEVLIKYGKPVVADSAGGTGEKWLYRSRKGKWLDRGWVYLYFDQKKSFTGWECGHTECV